MEIILKGLLMNAREREYKKENEVKKYYNLDIYCTDRLYTISVNKELYDYYKDFIREEVTIENVGAWAKGGISLYVKN